MLLTFMMSFFVVLLPNNRGRDTKLLGWYLFGVHPLPLTIYHQVNRRRRKAGRTAEFHSLDCKGEEEEERKNKMFCFKICRRILARHQCLDRPFLMLCAQAVYIGTPKQGRSWVKFNLLSKVKTPCLWEVTSKFITRQRSQLSQTPRSRKPHQLHAAYYINSTPKTTSAEGWRASHLGPWVPPPP